MNSDALTMTEPQGQGPRPCRPSRTRTKTDLIQEHANMHVIITTLTIGNLYSVKYGQQRFNKCNSLKNN